MNTLTLDLDHIVELLDRQKQRATYGAVAGLLGKAPRSLMTGRPKDHAHSWIVNQKSGTPSGFPAGEVHPALHARSRILQTPEELGAWLASESERAQLRQVE